MNRTGKTLIATALIVATAISLGGAKTSSAAALAPTQTVGEAIHFEAKPFCVDECPAPAAKLAGTGVHVAR
jgi:hypothetical protein